MNLLRQAQAFTLPARPATQALFSAAVASAVLGLEVAGRMATSDLHDGIAALGLFAVAVAVAAWHRRRPLAWASWLAAHVRRSGRKLGGWKYDHGVDFRGTPPLPRRLPPAAWGLAAALVLWGVAAVGVWEVFPGGWRDVGVRTSYVLYLVGLVAVWAALLAGLIVGLFVPVMVLERWLRDAVSDSDRRSIAFFASVAYLFAVVVARTYLVPAGALATCLVAAALAAWACARAPRSDVALLWRAAPGGGVYAVPTTHLLAGGIAALLLAYLDLVATGSSGRLFSHFEPTDAMPLTGALASLVAWTAPGMLLILAARLRAGRRANPAATLPPTVAIRTALPEADRDRAAAIVRGWGWNVRPANRPVQTGDVKIELVNDVDSQATEFDPRWPLAVSVADLAAGAVKDRLFRRDEIQLRRRFFAGFRTAFKKARAERVRRGGGFWFLPHWWFIDGILHEEPGRRKGGPVHRRVGPSLARALGTRPRQHWYRVLRGAQVDVIFIEDGVSPRSVERVLRTLLDTHDKNDGKRPADDHAFTGVPKVRVVVHEFSPDKPPASFPRGYKQPKYDELSRGRVLHIFRDRGEGEELSDDPFEFDSAPSPLLYA